MNELCRARDPYLLESELINSMLAPPIKGVNVN